MPDPAGGGIAAAMLPRRICVPAAAPHRTRRFFLLASALSLWLVGASPPACAHDIPGELRMHALVRVHDDQLRVLVRVPLALLLNLDLPKRGNGYLDLAHVQGAMPRAIAATAKDLVFLEDGQRLVPVHSAARISLPSDRSFQSYEQALASIRGAGLPPTTDVFWNQGYFDALIDYSLRSGGNGLAVDFHVSPGLRERLRLDLRLLTADGAVRAFELQTGAGPVPLDPRWYQAARSFIQSGFDHILSGADHLLFLLCLIIPFRRFSWPLVGTVTAFTVAHSITLIAAAYGLVPSGNWFPPLVEVLIAASILYVAIDNVVSPNLARRWMITAAFGLVHGFGFSFALANELQFAGSHLLVSLLAFNVGIELGQLLVLALVVPPLLLLQRWVGGERLVVLLVGALVGHSAWHWIGERWPALARADWPDLGVPAITTVAIFALVVLAAVLVARGLRAGALPRTALGRAGSRPGDETS